jgi:hypothetical protein
VQQVFAAKALHFAGLPGQFLGFCFNVHRL